MAERVDLDELERKVRTSSTVDYRYALAAIAELREHRAMAAQLIAKPGACPACRHQFESPDSDPFCSSCVDAGWDLAYRRGHAAATASAQIDSPAKPKSQ